MIAPNQNQAGERTQHTPGPWKKGATHCNPRARSYTTSVFSGDELVAEATTFFGRGRFITARSADDARLNSLANARLIEAAPELLEACIGLLVLVQMHIPNNSAEVHRAIQAISKTEGK